MKKITYVFLLILISFGCKKKEIVEVNNPSSENNISSVNKIDTIWKALPNFKYMQTSLLNSFSSSDSLYIVGRYFYYLTEKGNQDSLFNGNIEPAAEMFRFDINYILPINKDVYVDFVFGNDFVVHSVKNPLLSQSYKQLSIQGEGKSMQNSFNMPNFCKGFAMGLNNKNQLLVPYLYYDSVSTSSRAALYFVNLKISEALGSKYVDTVSTKTIVLPDLYKIVFNIFTQKDYFLFSMENTYKINSSGQSVKVYDKRMYKVFSSYDTLYAIGEVKGDKLLRSLDNGDTWSIVFSNLKSIFSLLNYYWIDNKIIASYFGQLFLITITANDIQVKEFKNSGLGDNYITSVSLFKNKIYVTTLSGVYYKNLKDFYQFKDN